MKICLDARMINASGIGTFIKNTLEALHKETDLYLLGFKGDMQFLARYSTHLIPVKSPIYSLKEQLELPLKIPKCTLFFSPHFNVPLLPILAKKRLTCVHDVYHLAHFSTLTPLQKLYAFIFYNAAFLSDHVMTVSEWSRSEILKYGKIVPKRLTTIHNCLRPKNFPQRNPRNFILAVGSLKPHKNLERLKEAALRLEMELVIVGKPFTSYLTDDELQKLYSEASVLVMPSLYEGFGFPPLEAMQAGCPVAVSKRASLPEICQEGAEYFDPLDIDSICQAIRRALHREKELVEKGSTIFPLYSLDRFKEKLLALIYSI